MKTSLFYSAALAAAASHRRFYAAPSVVSPGQHWSSSGAPPAAAMAASAPQWQPPPQQSFDAPAFEYPTGAELNYAAPGYEQPEYGYYGATELNYAAAEPAMSGGRFSEPLEVTAGSSSAAAELAAYFAAGSALGYGAYAALTVSGKERTERDVAIGAAGVGGFLGVFLFGSVSWAAFGAFTFAYGSTRNDKLEWVGNTAAAALEKAAEIDQKYLLSGKVKSATDQAILVGQNLNKNYGLTDKIDAQLQLTERSSAVSSKFQKVTDAVDDFKLKATTPPSALLEAGEP